MTLQTDPESRPAVRVLLHARHVEVDGRAVQLTPLEHDLLVHLLAHPDRVLTRAALLTDVWGWRTTDGSRTVDTHVARLRAKLGPAGAAIRTLHRVGYLVQRDLLDVVVERRP